MSHFSQDSSVRQIDLFNRLLETYRNYYETENRVAYLEGRAFRQIGKFISILFQLLRSRTSAELNAVEARIDNLKTATDLFARLCGKNYPALFLKKSGITAVSYPHVPYAVLHQHAWFLAHMESALFLWRLRFGEELAPEIALIEFNNYLSHLVVGEAVSEDTGIGHLNRAALDLCKEVLLADIVKMMSCPDRVEKFVQLRDAETISIGATFDDKKQIIKDYLALVRSVLGV